MSALSTPELSPVLSPTSRGRRLSSRRGSVAASDPWGAHNDVNMNPSRSLTSRLTIVRVPQPDMEEPPRRHRRHGSNSSLNSQSSGKGAGEGGGLGGRMSFAFSSFSPPGSQGATHGGRPVSPSASPRLRPSSPSSSRFPSALSGHSKLSPEQIMDLARTSVNPRSPLPSPNGPLSGMHSPIPAPVSFTPLPESVYLPFIERPAEVTVLIHSQPNARLFALLQQTFPPEARAPMGSKYEASTASPDSKEWTFADLEYWLTKVDRDVANDVHWIRKCRRCIMAHSELIWERVKGALGVPPELDVEDDGLELPHEEPAPTLTTEDVDANPFEPDSPVVSAQHDSDAETHDEAVVIEPVFVNQTPPHSAAADSMGSSLGDLREEDETDAGEDKKPEDEQEVRGLRISTSSTLPLFVPEHIAGRSTSSSPVVRPKFMAPGSDKDLPYDVLRERGPGHPLFPSNFAQLSLSPTLSKRTQSMSHPPRSAYLSPHATRGGRTSSIDAGSGRAAAMLRPEWARNWDPSKHEYAVTTASTSSFE